MTVLSNAAEKLLQRLTAQHDEGADVAVASVYPGINAFNGHAIAYLHNAGMLCKRVEAHDFAIFGALYCIRHGLELFLKCIAQNQLIDAVVRASRVGEDFEEIVKIARCDGKRKRAGFIKAICILRNVEAGLTFPKTTQVEIEERFARERLARAATDRIYRDRLCITWPVPIEGHDLLELWGEAADFIRLFDYDVRAAVRDIDVGEPLPPDEIQAVCELIHAWDDGGDAFRYPSSLAGDWYLELPTLSLRRLGGLAESLETTVRAYDVRLELENVEVAQTRRMRGDP